MVEIDRERAKNDNSFPDFWIFTFKKDFDNCFTYNFLFFILYSF